MKNTKKINSLKAELKNAKAVAERYPEDALLQEAYNLLAERIAAEIALIK